MNTDIATIDVSLWPVGTGRRSVGVHPRAWGNRYEKAGLADTSRSLVNRYHNHRSRGRIPGKGRSYWHHLHTLIVDVKPIEVILGEFPSAMGTYPQPDHGDFFCLMSESNYGLRITVYFQIPSVIYSISSPGKRAEVFHT